MKALVLLSLTALHLCCVLRISTGAILTEEMFNNQILKYIRASDIKNIPNGLKKNNEELKNGNVADKIMKDIDHLLSSLQIGEYDGNDDNSYNVSVGATCNWSENSFKCCQAFDLTGNTCLVAKFVGDDINFFVQIGGKMVWVNKMSYKNTIESMFRDISQLMSGNGHFEVKEQSEFLTEVKATSDNFVEMSRSSGDFSTTSCSWNGNTCQCCKHITIFKRKLSICVDIEVRDKHDVKISIKIGSITIWSGNVNMWNKQLEICHQISFLKLCLTMKDFHLSRHEIGGCVYVYGYMAWFKEGLRLFCFNKSF